MALSDKNIVITPNIGQSADPKIEFKGASSTLGPQIITLNIYPTSNGTLSFEGSAGQLFSIANILTGTIYSVNDVSGIPSIEVIDTGLVKLAQYSGNVVIGSSTDTGEAKLQVTGGGFFTGQIGNSRTTRGVYIGLSTGDDPQIQLQGNGATQPHIDFSNDTNDFDMRIILAGDDTLNITGGSLTVEGNIVLHAGNYTNYVSGGGGGSGLTAWSKKTANYTAAVSDRLIADTTASAFTITLPASPTVGQEVTIADGYDWRINNLTVARNGSTIEGLTDDVTLDIGGLVTTFIYDGSTWEIYISHGSGGGTITNDTTTNADTFYPTLAPNQTTGVFSQVKVSSSKLYYNPSTGQLNATNFNSLSDESAKCNIQTINNALATVEKMRGVMFDWIDTGEPGTGVLAGETEQVFSRIVSTNKTGKKSVAYGNALGLLVEAIKELSAEIKLLKGAA